MNKIVIGIVIIAVLVGGYFFLGSKGVTDEAVMDTPEIIDVEPTPVVDETGEPAISTSTETAVEESTEAPAVKETAPVETEEIPAQ